LFVWFGLTIAVVMGLVTLITSLTGQDEPPHKLGLAVSAVVLWISAGAMTHVLLRPLRVAARVANDLGEGKLDSRVEMSARCEHHDDEVTILGHAINNMADRIQKQMRDQRELLAAVSHEMRTPLGHMRVLVELAEERGGAKEELEAIEREIMELDGLVGQLLASSRLEFDTIDRRELDVTELTTDALERTGVAPELLEVEEGPDRRIDGDATLISRALTNLLENAKKHGGGVSAVRVDSSNGVVRFSVDDSGPGFPPDELDQVFDAFFRGDRRAKSRHGSLGLGLSLVRRIARAHGGEAWVENRPEGGATVGFTVARGSASPAE
jgi:signal transduction histidine kinase